MNFTTSEIILLIIIVSVILIVFVILTILDIKDYLRGKNRNVIITEEEENFTNVKENNTLAVNNIEEEKKYEINKKNVEIIKANDKPLIEESEIVFEEEDIDPFYEEEEVVVPTKEEVVYKDVIDHEEAREEINKVSKELMVEENESLSNTITNFEMEQEENAIISLDELMKVSDRLYEDNEPTQYDDGNEPITIDEVINRYNDVKNNKEEEVVVKAVDTVRDVATDMVVEEEEDFLTDLEIAHDNLRR